MRAKPILLALTIVASAVAVSGCEPKERIRPAFPPAADLRVQPQPSYPVDALTDPAVEERWNDDVLDWGRAGWAQVGRLCRWAQRNGAEIECPKEN